ncbi:MAG: acyltransferase [Candidatus Omnitrophota bacterium]
MKSKAAISIHRTSCVDKGSSVGKGTTIWHFSHVCKRAKIGMNCRIGQNVFIAPNVTIGNNVKIQNNVALYEGVILEDNVFCGPSSVFTNVINPRSLYPRNNSNFYKITHIKEGASIGANATIVCGITLGRHAFVGAGAVVTRNVPDFGLVYGNPARLKGWICVCGEKLKFRKRESKCFGCERRFLKGKRGVTEQ